MTGKVSIGMPNQSSWTTARPGRKVLQQRGKAVSKVQQARTGGQQGSNGHQPPTNVVYKFFHTTAGTVAVEAVALCRELQHGLLVALDEGLVLSSVSEASACPCGAAVTGPDQRDGGHTSWMLRP